MNRKLVILVIMLVISNCLSPEMLYAANFANCTVKARYGLFPEVVGLVPASPTSLDDLAICNFKQIGYLLGFEFLNKYIAQQCYRGDEATATNPEECLVSITVSLGQNSGGGAANAGSEEDQAATVAVVGQ